MVKSLLAILDVFNSNNTQQHDTFSEFKGEIFSLSKRDR